MMDLNRTLYLEEVRHFLFGEMGEKEFTEWLTRWDDEEQKCFQRAYSLERVGFGIKADDCGNILDLTNPEVVIPTSKMNLSEDGTCISPVYLGAYTRDEIQKRLMTKTIREAMSYFDFKGFQLADFYLGTISMFIPTTRRNL